MTTTDHNATEKAERDEEYYFADGSCTLLVENTLFKLHRWLLERDSAFFRAKFSLPRPTGHSDTNPFVCRDSAEDFRALCWVLYARPTDILSQQNREETDIPRLIRAVALAHKYNFEVIREWAFNVLNEYTIANPAEIMSRCDTLEIGRILDLSYECQRESLGKRIEKDWLDQISTPVISLTSLRCALDAIEKSRHLRQFHAKACYSYLKTTGILAFHHRDNDSVLGVGEIASFVDHGTSKLNADHKLHLYQGLWSLTQLRTRLSIAPKLDDDPQCTDHDNHCRPGWEAWWTEMLEETEKKKIFLDGPDTFFAYVQQRLADVPVTHPKRPFHLPTTISCLPVIKVQVELMGKEFMDGLVDHFMIP